MLIVVYIRVDDTKLPEELWRPATAWGTPEISMLLQDGDGGYHAVENVIVLDEDLET